MNKSRYSVDALMDIFGTPRPNQSVVWNWKGTWRDTGTRVQVYSFHEALKFLYEHDIDSLYYQIVSDHGRGPSDTGNYMVFYKDEHAVYFKLHNGFT
jgi:hypothetical protein